MDFLPTNIPEVVLVIPQVYQDDRGEFHEYYRRSEFLRAGISWDFVQGNHARSKQGVLRGLHYQIQQAQGKLVRAVAGKIFDVAVDLRKTSKTFGLHVGVILDDQEKKQLWIPPGFAHGYYVLSDLAEVSYTVTDYYAPKWERTLFWNDPQIGIDWPLVDQKEPILSENDAQGVLLLEGEVYE